MRDTFHDLETFSRVNLRTAGSHKYARDCEVMIWAFADGLDGTIYVWDLVHDEIWWEDELSGVWECRETGALPHELRSIIDDPCNLIWFHNGGQFDFPVLDAQLPHLAPDPAVRRDTMVQAFAHALPGALEKLGDILKMSEDQKKIKDGKALVRLFCTPQNEAFVKKFGTDRATRETHPEEWMRFIKYAGGDITTMRVARRKLPQWNYSTDKQVQLCLLDWKINARGFKVDVELAEKAVAGAEKAKAALSKRTQEITEDAVQATTQRDLLLAFILETHGVALPDMQADTLERRVDDPNLPEAVRELLKIRLQASMNSVSKFKTLLKMVCEDGRMRGGMQFRGAMRTGRWAHRGFQPGNLPRPNLPQALIDVAIMALKADDVELIDLVLGNVMNAISNTIRGAIIADTGKKLVVADLSNIEGRVAAWVAGEGWKLEAFRLFDLGEGFDLYILAYANSFNVPPDTVPKKGPQRQIGKVEELMFQYGGGVGAWITGAATYGIDLVQMTEQVYDTIPPWALKEAANFLEWMYEQAEAKFEKRRAKALAEGNDAVLALLAIDIEQAKVKARFALPEKVFITCDAIKRLWRRAHPAISSIWKELEDAVRFAIQNPGTTVNVRDKLQIRRKGGWLRIGLPSGRCLCYPEPQVSESGTISFIGLDTYTRAWGRTTTYGGKLFENVVQAIACDQLAEPMLEIDGLTWVPPGEGEDGAGWWERRDGDGFLIELHIHDEIVCETPDKPEYTAEKLAEIMCMDLGWNEGLPLAAAGFEADRYKKE